MRGVPAPPGRSATTQVYNKLTGGPAWVTAVNPSQGWLWFSLIGPWAVFSSTMFWMENHGRHGRSLEGPQLLRGN